MITAAALMLVEVCASDAQTVALRTAAQPRWASAADARPIEFSYHRDASHFVMDSARIAAPVTSAASVFMQVRKQKDAADFSAGQGAPPPQGRTLSVGMSVRW